MLISNHIVAQFPNIFLPPPFNQSARREKVLSDLYAVSISPQLNIDRHVAITCNLGEVRTNTYSLVVDSMLAPSDRKFRENLSIICHQVT